MSSPSSLFSAASTTSGLDADDDQEDDTKHGIGATQEQTSTPLDGSEQKLAETEASLRGVLSGATRTAPSIPGLYVFPGLLPAGIDQDALLGIADADHFHGGARDQVMLFTPPPASASSTLPLHLDSLLGSVSSLLHDHLPGDVHQTVFSQSLARQAILNLYPPGQGITPHIDLPNRYADGILGISLIGGTVMDFTHEKHGRHSVYLPSRSVYVLSGEARWDWKHGIEGRDRDVVDGVTILRDIRVSVTFRWMKQGGDVLS